MNNFNDSLAPYLHKQESIQFTFKKANAQQTACFQTIGNKLTTLEDSISFLQNSIAHLQPKLKAYQDLGDSHKISELRQKQRQFIIKQLEDKIKRLVSNEESTQTQLSQKQSMVFQLQYKCEQLRNENLQLKQEISKKNKQIKELAKSNATLKLQKSIEELKPKTEKSTINLSQVSIKKEETDIRNENYQQIQSKLKDMQDCLNEQIQQYKRKNILLQQQAKQLKNQLKQQTNNAKRIYELQLKVKNLVSQNKELQQSYTNQLAANNQNEVKFHKKINELKGQILQIKKSNKSITKQVDKQLRKLSASVLGANDKATIFIGATTMSDQFSQLTKQIIKCNKKQINSITLQKQVIIQDLKLAVETSKNKILELTNNLQKSKHIKLQKQKIQKAVLTNGSSTNRSNASKNQIQVKDKQNMQKIQQKYQQNINMLKNQLNIKQKSIEQMRKKFDQHQTNIVKKTLELASKLAEKQMQIKYLQEKCNNLTSTNEEMEKSTKEQKQKQVNLNKQKIKDLQKQRDQFKIKNRQIQDKLTNKEKQFREMERKQKQLQQKIKKYQQKLQIKTQEYQNLTKGKDAKINEMITKNQQLIIQTKLLQQKNKILESKQVKSQQPQTPTFSPMMQMKKQFIAEKEQLYIEIQQKNKLIDQLKLSIQQKQQSLKKKQQKLTDNSGQMFKLQNDNKLLQSEIQILKQSIQKLKTNKVEQQNGNFSQLKQQYEKRQKLLKQQTQKVSSDSINMKKQLEQQNKKLREQIKLLKQQIMNIKQILANSEEQKLKFDSQKFKDSERQRKTIKNYEQKIKQLQQKVQNLNKTLGQQNSPKKQIKVIGKNKNNFKGTDSVQYVEYGVSTQKLITKEQGMNTVDLFSMETQQNKGNSNILDFNDADSDHNKSRNKQALRNSNLFLNLNENNQHIAQNVDVFEICDENQQVNIGQSSIAFQLREIFTNLRIQIEKLFNEEQISLVVAKMLPQATQDDFYELMSYIKQKISQIKVHNELSFIRAEPGNEPQLLQDSIQFPQLLVRGGSEGEIILRKTIQEKDALIHSLMNDKTQQENTINQLTMEKEEKEEENQNRFMNQCNVYKKEIKEHKKHIDLLEMNFQSMKNVVRNVLEAYSTDEDMEDDFRQSMTMYAKVGKLSEKQRSRINFYIQKYIEIKGIQDAS